jgi:hypothetical protein
MEEKMIRFIDPQYNTLFKIPDGGSIVVTRPNGEQSIGICKYLDETHVAVNGSCYHICQFAEIQQRNGATVEPEKEPEMVGGHYRIIHRIPVGDKVYVLGHSPTAVQPYATWQAYRDKPGKDYGHYWSNRSDAWSDLLCRADAERTGKPYDHTKRYTQKKREDAR